MAVQTTYIDSDDGLDTNAGTLVAPWKTLYKGLQNIGDYGSTIIIRRGRTATIDNGSTLEFGTNGSSVNPYKIEADYDNAWGDFANSTQTYTTIFGSKTIEASETITDISAGQWIYNSTDNDDPKEFSYEVKTVSGTTLTLYVPFKGSAGSTKTLKIMPTLPRHGAANSNFYTNLTGSNLIISGINFMGTHASGVINYAGSNIILRDCITTGNGASDYAFAFGTTGSYSLKLRKHRSYNCARFISNFSGAMSIKGYIYDSYIDGNNATSGVGLYLVQNGLEIIDSEFVNHATSGISTATGSGRATNKMKIRNSKMGTMAVSLADTNGGIFIEDFNGTPNDTRIYSGLSNDDSTPVVQSEVTETRQSVGGGAISLKVTPSADISYLNEFATLKILDVPIYANTTEKTYKIYIKPYATTDFTADPTASELYMEAEYWGHATNCYRKIVRSTGVLDLNGTAGWQTLSLTITPAQVGMMYLRLFYGKTKESGKSNRFFVDVIPEVT